MKHEKIILEKREYRQLMGIIAAAPHNNDPSYAIAVGKLTGELKIADIRDEQDMPSDVVRLHSLVHIKTPFHQNTAFQLVAPEKSDISKNRLSILAPMGLALIGYASGDCIEWQFPSGIQTIEILSVEQPETALNKNLA